MNIKNKNKGGAGKMSSKDKANGERSSNTKVNEGSRIEADDNSNWYDIPQDIFKNRNNPINGINCFFSEATFNLIMGPEPSFEEKLACQIARIKSKEKELKQAESKSKQKKNKPSKVEYVTSFASPVSVIDERSCSNDSKLSNLCSSDSTEKSMDHKPELNTSSFSSCIIHVSPGECIPSYGEKIHQSTDQLKLSTKKTGRRITSSNVERFVDSEVNSHIAAVSVITGEPVDQKFTYRSTFIGSPENSSSNKLRENTHLLPVPGIGSISSHQDPSSSSEKPSHQLTENLKTGRETTVQETSIPKIGNVSESEVTTQAATSSLTRNRSVDESSNPTYILTYNSDDGPVKNENKGFVLDQITNPASLTSYQHQVTEDEEQLIKLLDSDSLQFEHKSNGSEVERIINLGGKLHSPDTSFSTNGSVEQNFSSISAQINLPSSGQAVEPIETDNDKLASNPVTISTVISSPQVDSAISKLIVCSRVVSGLEDNVNGADLTTENNKASPKSDTNPRGLTSSSNTNELCLVMPSLSSDEDEEEDIKDSEDITFQFSSNKYAYPDKSAGNDLQATTSHGNQPMATSYENSAGHNTTQSAQYCVIPSISVQDNQFETKPIKIQSDTATPWQNAEEVQTRSQVSYSYPHVNQADQKPYSSHPWSESDIPIFSVKQASPEVKKPVNFDTHQDKIVKAEVQKMETVDMDNMGAQLQAKRPNFQTSNLTKEEHAMYLKLYNKYIGSFKQGAPPPMLTETQFKEVKLFEKLQRQVQEEQAAFQNYLYGIARKNCRSYTYLKPEAKQYAITKFNTFRKLKKDCIFDQLNQSVVSFCPEARFIELKFQQTLLEVGVPPNIKLPDVQGGLKPELIPVDFEKLNSAFPMHHRKIIPEHIHHEFVSQDTNVTSLARKYNIQVVMSSSVVKCLLDNHGPSFNREWIIPVNVVRLNLDGKNRKIVYLDKPASERKAHIKDFSTLFHKYALRALVSHPKHRLTQKVRQPSYETEARQVSEQGDDFFDKFSTDAGDLDTFGVGYGKSNNTDKATFQEPGEDSVKRHKKSLSMASSSTPEEGSVFNKNASQKKKNVCKKGGPKRPYQIAFLDDPETQELVGWKRSKKESNEHHQHQHSLLPPECDYSPQSPEHAPMDIAQHTKLPDTNHTMLSPASTSVSNQNSLSKHLTIEIPISPVKAGRVASISSVKTMLSSPVTERFCPILPVKAIPFSPVRETPLSPVETIPFSPVRETPLSPVEATVTSSTKVIPTSPVKETLLPLAPTKMQPSPSAASKPCWRSPRRRASNPAPSDPCPAGRRGNKPSQSAQSSLFAPLDAILGPSFGNTGERNVHNISKEDPSQYLPPTEVNSSLVYSLWSLGSISVLIRSRCHGIIKDLKKTRRVYFSPKMEYQPTYGFEQVTLKEAARDWTACYIRPNTNLLRARINAFKSEIMMLEELETSQILQPSLNFRPEHGFQLLDRILTQVLSLNCGEYFICHDPGDNFCGIRSAQPRAFENKAKGETARKKVNPKDQIPWIPIDPTKPLPCHIAYNRIPATFLPKDYGEKRTNPNKGNEFQNQHWRKKKNKKPRTNDHVRYKSFLA